MSGSPFRLAFAFPLLSHWQPIQCFLERHIHHTHRASARPPYTILAENTLASGQTSFSLSEFIAAFAACVGAGG